MRKLTVFIDVAVLVVYLVVVCLALEWLLDSVLKPPML